MRTEDTTHTRRRLQVGILLAGMVSPGMGAMAEETQCPCPITIDSLEKNAIPPRAITNTSCKDLNDDPQLPRLRLEIDTEGARAIIDIDRIVKFCTVSIGPPGAPPRYATTKGNLTDQQLNACEEDLRRTARALQAKCPEKHT
jgi:hypothetical protein